MFYPFPRRRAEHFGSRPFIWVKTFGEVAMDKNLEKEMRKIEDQMWREFRAVLQLPDAVPPEVRLRLLHETYEDEVRDGHSAEFHRLFPDAVNLIIPCSRRCPECRILPWCDYAREQFSPDDILWMQATGNYPPGGRPESVH